MHELSIAMALVTQATEVCEREGGNRVLNLTVSVGVLSGVDREALEFCFPLAAKGTPLEGSVLMVRDEKLKVECRVCNDTQVLETILIRCPSCQSSEVRVIEGADIRLEQLEVNESLRT